jgi:predicted DNA-binding transcriptional regulator YafY
MATNKQALLRYKTIDKCLANRLRKWTLDDLINAVDAALYKYNGIENGISKRTIQLDIQSMRSDELGYNAPIIITNKKYYSYDDANYSITKSSISNTDLEKLQDVVSLLKQFKGFSFFEEVGSMVEKLESKVLQQSSNKRQYIDFEKNELLKGLNWTDVLLEAVKNEQVLNILYQSFKAKAASTITVSPYLLKEYRNRWFLLCRKHFKNEILIIAFDRIQNIETADKIKFIKAKDFDIATYFDDVLGPTKMPMQKAVKIILKINAQHAPYVITKPIHKSQTILKTDETCTIISLQLVTNFELEREIIGFGENMEVLSPRLLRKRIISKIAMMQEIYKN